MRPLPPYVAKTLAWLKERQQEKERAPSDTMKRANEMLFKLECQVAGVDPAKGVSPSLIALVKEQNERRAQ